eukprot:m51a1_g12834 hypothetical protein (341) ;mRNA; f:782-2324
MRLGSRPPTTASPRPRVSTSRVTPSSNSSTRSGSSGRGSSKVDTFLQFLDEVEESTVAVQAVQVAPVPQYYAAPARMVATPVMAPAVVQVPQQVVVAAENPASSVFASVKARIASLENEMQVKDAQIRALQDVIKTDEQRLAEAETKGATALVEREKREKEKLAKQHKQYQEALARHLAFIDKLTADKKELTSQVEEFAREIQELQASSQKKIAEVEGRNAESIRIEKEKWIARERANREKWAQSKAKELKELTIRGMEPELQRIIEKHQKDLKQLEESHATQLEREKQNQALAIERAKACFPSPPIRSTDALAGWAAGTADRRRASDRLRRSSRRGSGR